MVTWLKRYLLNENSYFIFSFFTKLGYVLYMVIWKFFQILAKRQGAYYSWGHIIHRKLG